ncbi:MAG TPA: DegT/DnrJ/EryC1/StrS family aminotransferase [Candidatus Limnocylindria bacterium]|nr:DegT/DnrJ/EryC1/StrS family aminotransferase [Candidatus Limnocylindria bacterium]
MDAEPQIWLTRPQTDEAEIDEIREVLASGTLTQGPKVAELESMVAGLVGTQHAFATTSATTALHLSLVALGIGPGDEVLVPDFTFPATANVVVQQGATPVLVDIELDRFGVDPADLDARVTPRTRAIMPVHAFGLAADMDPVRAIADRHGLAIVEDAACALGATYDGQQVGTFGMAGCFSFHPRKSITTGEGGMITTADDALADQIRLLRSHGGVRVDNRFTFEAAGFNYRMSDILAAVGVAQMRKLPAFLEARRRVAGWYGEALADAHDLRLPVIPDGSTHTFQSYVVLLDEGLDRDAVIRRLRDDRIETTLGTYALHAQPFFARSFGYRRGDRPRSLRAFDSSLALPLHGGMIEGDVARVADRLRSALSAS